MRADDLVPVQSARLPQAVQGVRRSVVRVIAESGRSRNVGSGVHLGDGIVLTAAHVVEGGQRFSAGVVGEALSSARLLVVDKALDVALLKLTTPPRTSARLATSVPQIGSRVISVGWGSAKVLRWNLGRMESFTGVGERTGMFWSGSSRSGDSGGPAFNVAGLVVGILSGTSRRSTHGTHVGKLWAFVRPWCQRKARQPAPKPDQRDDLREQIAELRAAIERLKKEKGPKGDEGPRGTPGIRGALVDVDYKRIVDELAKRPITVQIVDANGNVKQQQKVYLGGTLRLRHRPVGD